MPAHNTAAVQFLTSGTYKREEENTTGVQYTAGTESELELVSDNIQATVASDAMYSWIRFEGYLFETAGPTLNEWALIRCLGTDALQDLNDEAEVADLHREGRILKRGTIYNPTASYGRSKPIKFELYSVKLLPGEELRLVIRPMRSMVGPTGEEHLILEWRKVGE